MNSRDRVGAILSHQEPDRVGFVDFMWAETIERWEREGLPKGAFLQDHFGMDVYIFGTDLSPKYEAIVYEEGDRWRTFRDAYGVKMKAWRGRSGVPDPMEPIIKNLDDFKERIEPLLDPELPIRISSSRYPFRGDIEVMVQRFQERFFVTVGVLGPFEYARHIFGGVDKVLPVMVREPATAGYIMRSVASFASKIASAFLKAGVDGLWIWDDIAYVNGPFFSPKTYRDLLLPAHAAICSSFRSKGLPVVLHTDGDVRKLIPHFIEAGITVLQPLEAKANMDVRLLKEQYGDRLSFIGNIDARVLSTDDVEMIDREVKSKVSVAGVGGGYVLGSDHSIPPAVSLKTYEEFAKMVKRHGTYPLAGGS